MGEGAASGPRVRRYATGWVRAARRLHIHTLPCSLSLATRRMCVLSLSRVYAGSIAAFRLVCRPPAAYSSEINGVSFGGSTSRKTSCFTLARRLLERRR